MPDLSGKRIVITAVVAKDLGFAMVEDIALCAARRWHRSPATARELAAAERVDATRWKSPAGYYERRSPDRILDGGGHDDADSPRRNRLP